VTTRELLAEAARLLENAHDYHVIPTHRPVAAFLRLLATRFDEEMADTQGDASSLAWHIQRVLLRLDAPLVADTQCGVGYCTKPRVSGTKWCASHADTPNVTER